MYRCQRNRVLKRLQENEMKEQVESLIAQQSSLRREAARCWNLALVHEIDQRLIELSAYLKTW